MTDAFEEPTDAGVDANPAAGAPDEAFTAADLVAAGEALAPDQAIDERSGPVLAGAAEATEPAEPADPVASGGPASELRVAPSDIEPGDASLLGLIDRLGAILERSDLTELEVEAGRTTVVLRKPAAVATLVAPAAPAIAEPPPAAPTAAPGETGRGAASGGGAPARPSVKAPLTGIWYASPTPGSAPFVEVGRELAIGQVVGLIEAMKLFNEIKSDIAGRVVRVVPDSGTLVKAKQPLIEVDPL
jgi:acetyl-CoA carboxylase biotin carboxyl carrier protein